MTDLELYQPPDDSPTVQALAIVPAAAELIDKIVKTNFVPAAYRGKPAEALACVLTGDMIGLHPLVALREIDVIQGTPAYSAKLQRALVQRAGHKMWLVESTPTKCVMAGHRADDPEHVQQVTWTIERAQKLNLTGKQNWRQQPTAMLVARCSGELARLLAADELLGLAYNIEEVRDGTTSDEDVVDAVPVDVVTEAPEGAAAPPKPDNRRSIPAKKAAAKKAAARPAPAPSPPVADPVEDFDEIDGVAAGPQVAQRDRVDMGADVAGAPAGDDLATRRAQMLNIRIREVLGDLDRAEKLAFVSASAGRAVASSKDLTSEEVDRVTVDLDLIAGGRATWTDGKLVEDAEVVDDDEGQDAPTDDASEGEADEQDEWTSLDATDWKASVRMSGARVADVLREADRLAQELGVEAPTTVPGIAETAPELRRRLSPWLQNRGKA